MFIIVLVSSLESEDRGVLLITVSILLLCLENASMSIAVNVFVASTMSILFELEEFVAVCTDIDLMQ